MQAYTACAVIATKKQKNRTTCPWIKKNDNVALSFIMLFIEEMAHISDQSPENHAQDDAAPSDNPAVSANGAEAQASAGLLSPLAAATAGVRGDLGEKDRADKFAGHSLRAGLASSAEVEERYVQKQLGHASAEMTRKYQRRRDRFRVNLTKAAGL